MIAGPFGHDLLKGLVGGRDQVRAVFDAEAELVAAVRFEAALALAEAAEGVIPAEDGTAIAESLQSFAPDLSEIESGVARDGVFAPALVKQLRAHVGNAFAEHVHFGATSQDVLDTSLVMRLADVTIILESDLKDLASALTAVEQQFGDRTLMGVTRMQEALPLTVADRVAAWRGPVQRHLARLHEIKPRLLLVQFGGAVGTLDKLGDKGLAVRARLAAELGLGVPEGNWHSQRDAMAEFASWLSLVTGALGKLGQDVALMALRGEVRLKEAGGSSAMPHKQNPVDAEALVTLARFNATQVSGVHHALVHEMERSGAAWTLEWMVLPQMVIATSAALVRAGHLLSNIGEIGEPKA